MKRLSHATFVAVAKVTVPASATVVRRIRHAASLVAVPETARPMYETFDTVSLRTDAAPPLGVAHAPSPLRKVDAEGVPVAEMVEIAC